MENTDEFWKSAKTPDGKPEADENKKSAKAKQALKDKNVEKPKAKPRFSLSGQEAEEGDDTAETKAEHILARVQKREAAGSPSESSRVSTAAPTPTSATQPEEPPEEEVTLSPPEGARETLDEEQEEVVATQASVNSPIASTLPDENKAPEEEEEEFPVDDDDDMPLPSPPDAEDTDLSMREDEAPPAQEEVFPLDVDDDYDDDDDKEGPGFAIVHDPETPESVRAERLKEEQERKKKGKRKKKDTSSVAAKSTKSSRSTKSAKSAKSTAAKTTKPKRSKKKVTFPGSPMGYPAGNREYEIVPVTDFKDSPEDDGLRRSRRAKVKPLAFWKNERPLYEAHHEDGELGEAMGLMPVVAGYISAQPTPYKKRKVPAAATKDNGKQKKAKKGSAAVAAEVEDTPFDSRKLRKVQ